MISRVAWEAEGCPQPGKRPGEGDIIFTRADGFQVRRYYVNVLLVGCEGRLSEAAMYAGLGVGSVRDIPSAGDLVKRLWAETETARRAAR